MRIYCSGPMTGLPDHNKAAFSAAAEKLRAQGHFVINPAELSALFGTAEDLADSFECLYRGMSQVRNRTSQIARAVMDADLAAVRSCNAIYLLHGWETSRGAKRELAEAIDHGLTILQEGEDA